MTLASDIVTRVQSHLGDRSSGTIGSQTVDAACLDSVNKAVRAIAKNASPNSLKKQATLSVSSSNYSYSLPTTDGAGAAIRIRDILSPITMKLSGDNYGHPLVAVPVGLRERYWPIMDADATQGRPYYYTIYGTEIWLYPWPQDTYILYMNIMTWPQTLASGDTIPYEVEWEDALEAYATADLYAKLQQNEDAATWFTIFRRELRDTIAAWNTRSDRMMDMRLLDIPRDTYSAEPGLDPFVRSWF